MTQACLAQRWDLIFFTGGAYVGKMVAEAAAKHLTPTILELGGKSPAIVDASVNINVAARRLAWGSFANAGQTCVRPDHLYVHEDIADKFLAALKSAVRGFYGQPVQQSEEFGRLINTRAQQRVAGLVQASKEYVAMGGECDEADLFVAPTVLDFGSDVEAFERSEAMKDEIFGPVLPMLRYSSLDQVLAMVATREKPLALYFFSSDSAAQEKVLSTTTSGGAVVNDVMMHLANPSLPFGGVGASGMGNYHGKYSFDSFSHQKAVLKKYFMADVPARYPPYAIWKKAALSIVQKPRSASEWSMYKLAGLAATAGFVWSKL